MSNRTRQPTPSTDEQIAAATVGEPDRIDGPIQLAEPDPAWPDMFVREAQRISSVLGDRVQLLEHVGSTSVPGLPAKPIIDMAMAVADSADEELYVSPLEQAGYALRIREPDWQEHRVLKGPDTNINLHVFTVGSPEIARMIGFRDHLRSHPEDLARYAKTKRELAGRTWKFVQNYADAKSAVIEKIISRALPT